MKTMIQIDIELREKLKSLRLTSRDSYNEIISRLVDKEVQQ